jgi:hypothetical protein
MHRKIAIRATALVATVACLVMPGLAARAQADAGGAGEDYARPDLLRQFETGRYETNSLELRQYALALFEVIDELCDVPEPIRLAAGRLRSSIENIGVQPGHPAGSQDAAIHHERHGCSGAGQRFRIHVMRYIDRNQEVPRSEFYAAQPPSLFNACVRDNLRRDERNNRTIRESSTRTWCECSIRQIGRYVTPEDQRGLLEDYTGYMNKLEEARDYRLAYRLNPCRL